MATEALLDPQNSVEQPFEPAPLNDQPIRIIEPTSGWRLINWKELREYRDLFFFLIWRGIKARYAQSTLGVGWAIIQPVFSMLVFTVVFGKLAKIQSDGVPYALFSFAALVPWTYFANALTDGTQSLVTNAHLLSKVYFPRSILPLSAVVAKLVDFAIASVILAIMMACYGVIPTPKIVLLPLLVVVMMIAAGGLAMWLSALAVQYRDVNYAIGFIVQLLMYAAPVVYPASAVPSQYTLFDRVTINPQLLYGLNPMVGVIEGFRAALLGTRDMPWTSLGLGTATAVALAISGMLYFHSREQVFADVA
jgi:lipopolysaccharide transport system permease protein